MDNKTDPSPNVSSGTFIATLAALKSGQVLARVDDMLREVTKAVGETQLGGSVTLTLHIAPNGVGVGDVPLFKVTAEPKRKVPEKPEKGQSFYADTDHNLTRRNPTQEEWKLTVVSNNGEGKAPALKEANG